MNDEVEVERFHPISLLKASDDITKFDEHTVTNSYKVGVVYQTFGQVFISFLLLVLTAYCSTNNGLTHAFLCSKMSSGKILLMYLSFHFGNGTL